jgi:hypothetical protein
MPKRTDRGRRRGGMFGGEDVWRGGVERKRRVGTLSSCLPTYVSMTRVERQVRL